MEIDLEKFKKLLLDEKESIEADLPNIAEKNPDNPDDWVPKPAPTDIIPSDKNDLADRFEDFEERRSTEVQLEIRLNNIKKALKNIEDGTYGICEVSGEKIDIERLEANPAATTCIKHAE